MTDLPLFEQVSESLDISPTYHPSQDVTLYLGDRLELLSQIQARGDKAELVVTSPPYNTGKEYEQVVSLDEYIQSQRETIAASVGILSPTGSICWQVGHYIEGSAASKEAFPLDLVLYPVFKEFGLRLRNRIIWHFGHGLHEKYRLSGRHETILWFTRSGDDFTFNLDAIRVPQKYPGKRAFRGPKRGKLSGNPLGKNPSDVWSIPNVKANHVEKTEHPCQFPVALVERLTLGLSNPGDLVVDPYIGVGTTAVAAVLRHRRVAGADTSAHYLEIARDRVRAAWMGTIKTRPLNKPVYTPGPGVGLAQVPEEWQTSEPKHRRLLDGD